MNSTSENLENASKELEKITNPSFWTSINLQDLLVRLITAGISFVIGYIIIQLIINFLNNLLKKRGVNPSGLYYIEKIAKFILYFILVTIIANTLGFETGTLIAVVASLGVALALALRDSLTDLASGIMLISTRPIKVGDWVFLEDIDEFLQVTEIRLFQTSLRSRRNFIHIVPNHTIMQKRIENLSKDNYVYTDIIFGVGYANDFDEVRQIITEALDNDPDVVHDKEYLIGIHEYGDFVKRYIVSIPVRPENYYIMQVKMLEEVRKALEKNNVVIPYPVLEVKKFRE